MNQATLHLIVTSGLTTTRRSAGIPHIIVALLSATKTELILNQFITDMKAIVKRSIVTQHVVSVELPEVHALNALRAVFTTTSLAACTRPYIVEVTDLAVVSLGSPL